MAKKRKKRFLEKIQDKSWASVEELEDLANDAAKEADDKTWLLEHAEKDFLERRRELENTKDKNGELLAEVREDLSTLVLLIDGQNFDRVKAFAEKIHAKVSVK